MALRCGDFNMRGHPERTVSQCPQVGVPSGGQSWLISAPTAIRCLNCSRRSSRPSGLGPTSSGSSHPKPPAPPSPVSSRRAAEVEASPDSAAGVSSSSGRVSARGCRRDAEEGLLRSPALSLTRVLLRRLAPHCRNWSNWLFCFSLPALHLYDRRKKSGFRYRCQANPSYLAFFAVLDGRLLRLLIVKVIVQPSAAISVSWGTDGSDGARAFLWLTKPFVAFFALKCGK